MKLPSISVVIPVLNSMATIWDCLNSIINQDYPKENLEIVLADAGSTDGTSEIIKSTLSNVNYQLLPNPLKTGEAGKAVCIKHAKNEIIALIDSDNILPQPDWIKSMVEPFSDPDIIASEPLYYTYRRTDSYITRYSALLGMNDPLCMWLGNYDRYCMLTNKWTEVIHSEEDKGNFLKVELPVHGLLPTIGANGFLIRKEIFKEYRIGDYLFDIDVLYDLLSHSNYKIAKVRIGIIHIYCRRFSQFMKKQRRRIKDYAYFNALGLRKYPWDKIEKKKVIKFCFAVVFPPPLLLQAARGFLKKRDSAWLFHPIACWVTFLVYGYNTIKGRITRLSTESRHKWGQ